MPTLATNEGQRKLTRRRLFIALIGLFLLAACAVGLRVIALDSDPYKRLDWSSGLLTDEGFYLHNARNQVLFGHPQTDDFNNALLSPTLSAAQTAVFRRFGAGLLPARLISVAAGLLTLPLFFAALRRAYNLRAAALATGFLAFDHLPLLYGRMALMDTPAALILVAAFYCWTRAHSQNSAPPTAIKTNQTTAPMIWLWLCGATLGLAFATRGLCAFVLPVPLLLLGRKLRGGKLACSRLLAFASGLAFALALYFALWMLPNRAELSRVNAFYLHQQLLPHSFAHFVRIVARAFFGDTRGIAPALLRHTPVLSALVIVGVWQRWRVRRESPPLSENSLFLGGWLASGLLVFTIAGYSPSRYFLLFYHAFTAIAALSLPCDAKIAPFLSESRRARALLGGFFAYHLALFARPSDTLTGNLLVAAITISAAIALYFAPSKTREQKKGNREQGTGSRKMPAPLEISANFQQTRVFPCSLFPVPCSLVFLLLLWAAINALWLGDWLRNLDYTQRDAGRWLTAHLPPDAVLLGDVAPGLSVDTPFVSVPVIPGLCNDARPVERFPNKTRAIIILDGARREAWWDRNYPALVRPEDRAASFPDAVGFPVGVYVLPPDKTAR